MQNNALLGGVIGLAALALLPAPARSETAPAEPQATFVDLDSPEARIYRDTGDRAIDRLAITMITDVANGVANKGAVATMNDCHLKDLPMKSGTVAGLPRITAMKLTSLKLRNPGNAPDAAEMLALQKVKRELDIGTPPSILVQKVVLPNGSTEWRVYKPLANIRQCGVCHARPDEMPEDLRLAIQQKYPNDQATGYSQGEWRGVIRVTVADPPPPPPPPAPKPAPTTKPQKAKKG